MQELPPPQPRTSALADAICEAVDAFWKVNPGITVGEIKTALAKVSDAFAQTSPDTASIINFNAARADRGGDSRLWTPRDALTDAMRWIDDAKIVYVAAKTYKGNFPYVSAKGTTMEYVGLLHMHAYDICKRSEA